MIGIAGALWRVYVLGHTGISGTLSLTVATVSALTTGEVQLTGTGPRVHGDGLADDEAIADKLANGLTRVGVGNLGDLIGIEPDLALTASDDGRRQALLSAEVDPLKRLVTVVSSSWSMSDECRLL